MNVEILSTVTEKVSSRSITIDGLSFTLMRNEIEKQVSTSYSRLNADNNRSNITLRYNIATETFVSATLSNPINVDDYTLFEVLKTQVIAFDAEFKTVEVEPENTEEDERTEEA